MYVYIHMYMCVCMYTHMCMYMCVGIYVCLYIYIYIYALVYPQVASVTWPHDVTSWAVMSQTCCRPGVPFTGCERPRLDLLCVSLTNRRLFPLLNTTRFLQTQLLFACCWISKFHNAAQKQTQFWVVPNLDKGSGVCTYFSGKWSGNNLEAMPGYMGNLIHVFLSRCLPGSFSWSGLP